MRLSDIAEALGLLTRLPVRLQADPRGAKAAWAYPLAGGVVGGLGALVALATQGAPPALSAGLVLAVMIVVTGALHEDGLADTADGLWGGWTKERRLDIMKDSHIGTYGVLALILVTGLRWVAMTSLVASGAIWAILGTAVLSRVPMVLVMAALVNARGKGLSALTGRPDPRTAGTALAIALCFAVAIFGWNTGLLVVILGGTTLAIILLSKAKIGGQTGDILGATQQVSEIAILATLTTLTL